MEVSSQKCQRCRRPQWRLRFRLPFITRQMDGYDITRDSFVRGRFRLWICLGSVGHVPGVSRFSFVPFLIWSWAPPIDGLEISSREAVFR